MLFYFLGASPVVVIVDEGQWIVVNVKGNANVRGNEKENAEDAKEKEEKGKIIILLIG